MAAGALRYRVDPRLVPAGKAARRLFLTIDEFRKKLPALIRSGFPEPCPVTGHFDLIAIDAWLDQRSGLAGREKQHDVDAIINARLDAL